MYACTLQMLPSDNRMFLAARSLWTKPLLDKYCIPRAICWQNTSSVFGVNDGNIIPGLLVCMDVAQINWD